MFDRRILRSTAAKCETKWPGARREERAARSETSQTGRHVEWETGSGVRESCIVRAVLARALLWAGGSIKLPRSDYARIRRIPAGRRCVYIGTRCEYHDIRL